MSKSKSKDWMWNLLLVILYVLISAAVPTALVLFCLRGCSRFMEDAEGSHAKFEKEMNEAMERKVRNALEDNSEGARWNRFIRGGNYK